MKLYTKLGCELSIHTDAIAEEVAKVSEEMGVPESSIVTFALRQFLLNYRKEQHEARERVHSLVTA